MSAPLPSDSPDHTLPVANWTWAGFGHGLKLGLPFGASSFIYGIAFGLLAIQAGLSIAEAVAMSALVFSGTAQMAIMQTWASALSLVAIASTVLLVNVRYVLMGASLRPWLAPLGPVRSAATLLTIVDGSYAVGLREYQRGNGDAGLMAGVGVISWSGWCVGTAAGFFTGAAVPNPRDFGLDFVVVAFCAAAVGMMIGAVRDYVPVLVAIAAVVLAEWMALGPWVVVIGGLAAAFAGAARYAAAGPSSPPTEPKQ